jgi:hypothetical protein
MIVSTTTALLFGGLQVATLFEPTLDENELSKLRTPLALFLGVGIPVVVLEALLWTVAFVELSAKLAKSPVIGAILGVLAYGVVFHWAGGMFSVLVSTWIALVLNGSYVLLRQRSRPVAIVSTVAHKIAFILYAAFSIYTHEV